jgi:pimeloyl-ACP methyl ester carboxylesterase
MHIHLCIGLLESRDGPFLGLRDFMTCRVLPRFPGTSVCYNSWRDNVAEQIAHYARHGNGPLILLGHSYGASALFRAARKLPRVAIDHFIMLDPVPRWLWWQFQWTCYRLPRNVRAATCLYNPISLPKSSPIRSLRGGAYRNVTVSPWHASIPGDAGVQAEVFNIIAATGASACGHPPAKAPAAIAPGSRETVKVPPVVVRGL